MLNFLLFQILHIITGNFKNYNTIINNSLFVRASSRQMELKGCRKMASYKHPCKYCGKLIARDSNFCPFCTQENPLGPIRCPICRYPLEDGAKACGHCGILLWKICESCGKRLFWGTNAAIAVLRLLLSAPTPNAGPNSLLQTGIVSNAVNR